MILRHARPEVYDRVRQLAPALENRLGSALACVHSTKCALRRVERVKGTASMSEDDSPKKPAARASDTEDWRDIAEKAANEKDPHKLIQLVATLCDKLDEQDAVRKRSRKPTA